MVLALRQTPHRTEARIVTRTKQSAVVHLARKQLGLTHEEYRAVLLKMAHVEGSADLDQTGFELMMQCMATLGFRSDFTKPFTTAGVA